MSAVDGASSDEQFEVQWRVDEDKEKSTRGNTFIISLASEEHCHPNKLCI